MNRQLVKAVVASFREATVDEHYARLAVFDDRAWRRSYGWLDASGLALYFLERVKTLQIEDALPVEVLQRLEENAEDNCLRAAGMLEEYVKINRAFQGEGLRYVNLKGFTLVPDACPNPSLRCQFDLDFAVLRNDVPRCEEILKQHGYWLAGFGDQVREFKTGNGRLPSVRELYKASAQYAVEVHFADSSVNYEADSFHNTALLTQSRIWKGLELPVLPECDKFFGLVIHLFKHLRGEWTRTSWILEYRSYVAFHRTDEDLWLDVRERLSANSNLKTAVGAVTLIAEQTFGELLLPPVLLWALRELPGAVRLWIERYGSEVVLAKFPGSKLYLLLHKALDEDKSGRRGKRRSLLPLHRPSRVAHPVAGERWVERFGKGITEIRYVAFRLWFHVGKGLAYMLEVSRWNRCVAGQ